MRLTLRLFKNCQLVRLVGFVALCVCRAAIADVRLPDVLSDHMVLQQNADVTLWGWAFSGEGVDIATSWGVSTKVVADASGRWRVTVHTPPATPLSQGLHPEHITFTVPNQNSVQVNDILIGEVWLCSGQSNMQMIMAPSYPAGWCAWYGEQFWNEERKTPARPALRIYAETETSSATPQEDCRAILPPTGFVQPDKNGVAPPALTGWQACTKGARPYFNAVPYYFGAMLQDKLDVPVGLVVPVSGGTIIEAWVRAAALKTVPAFANSTPQQYDREAFSGLYNGMIAPLTDMTYKGTIWYQGESNVGDNYYGVLFPLLINDWRMQFDNPSMPFYFVQVAPFGGHGTTRADVREAQKSGLTLPNTGMALSIDVSDTSCIHPKDKRDVAFRLASIALTKTYGISGLTVDSPTPASVSANNGSLTIAFQTPGGGLKSRDGKPLTCFQLAGSDGVYVDSKAVITGDSVVVSSPTVSAPVSVRFAWGDGDVPNLESVDGLPAGQFKLSVQP